MYPILIVWGMILTGRYLTLWQIGDYEYAAINFYVALLCTVALFLMMVSVLRSEAGLSWRENA